MSEPAGTGPAPGSSISITALMMLFMLVPLLVVDRDVVLRHAFVAFPPQGFTLQWYVEGHAGPDFPTAVAVQRPARRARRHRARCCSACRPRSRWCATAFPAATLIQGLVLSPLIFPMLVTGIALLQLLSTIGSACAASTW